jgi:hypothetical protein
MCEIWGSCGDDMTLLSPIEVYRGFGWTYCPYFQGWKVNHVRKQASSNKRKYLLPACLSDLPFNAENVCSTFLQKCLRPSTRLQDIISQKTEMCSTAVPSWVSAVWRCWETSFISTSNYCQFIMVMMFTPTDRIPSLFPTFQHVSVCLADVRCLCRYHSPDTLPH